MTAHLLAFLGNAQDDGYEVLYAIGTQNDSGDWYTDEGTRVWPFWQEPIALPEPELPEDWLDHLAAEAQRFAAQQRDERRPSGLAALLARSKPEPVAMQPIARRGF